MPLLSESLLGLRGNAKPRSVRSLGRSVTAGGVPFVLASWSAHAALGPRMKTGREVETKVLGGLNTASFGLSVESLAAQTGREKRIVARRVDQM